MDRDFVSRSCSVREQGQKNNRGMRPEFPPLCKKRKEAAPRNGGGVSKVKSLGHPPVCTR